VYQVELEGSRSQLRIQAKQLAGITERLPIVHVTKTPPALIGAGKRVSSDWKKWASAIVRKAKAAAERFGVPLKLVTIDPQNHFAGFTDEQSSAEGNVVCKTPGYARYSGYDTEQQEDEYLSVLGPVWCDGDPMPESEIRDDAVNPKRGRPRH
jgi:hypothetical protein